MTDPASAGIPPEEAAARAAESLKAVAEGTGHLLRTVADSSDSRERTGHLNAKYSLSLTETNSFVAGAEVEGAHRAGHPPGR